MNSRGKTFAAEPKYVVPAVCLLVGALFSLPLIVAWIYRYEGLTLANESVAYRWGHSSRMAFGDTPPILPQGFTILAIQQQLVRAIEWYYPPSFATLRASLQWFCWGSFGVFSATFAAILLGLTRIRNLSADEAILITLPCLVPLWGTWYSGLFNSLRPDYYYMNAILGCAVIWRLQPFAASLRDPTLPGVSLKQSAYLGFALGVAVANKLTWGVPSLVAAGAVVLARRSRLSQIALHVAVLAAVLISTVMFVLLAYYQFSPNSLMQGIREWFGFMQGQQGEFPLWSQSFFSMMSSYNCDFLYPFYAIAICVSAALAGSWRSRVFATCCLAGFFALLWAASKRPAGSTIWDTNSLLVTVTVLSVLSLRSRTTRRVVAAVWLAAIVGLILRHPPRQFIGLVAATEAAATNRFEVYDTINAFAAGRPQLVLFPNNEYHHEGVHELLLKAAADFPSWNVSQGGPWLKRTGGDITFLHEYGAELTLPDNAADLCVVWFDRPDLPLLTSRHERLATLARDPGSEVISMPIFTVSPAKPPQVQVWAHALRLKPSGHLRRN